MQPPDATNDTTVHMDDTEEQQGQKTAVKAITDEKAIVSYVCQRRAAITARRYQCMFCFMCFTHTSIMHKHVRHVHFPGPQQQCENFGIR